MANQKKISYLTLGTPTSADLLVFELADGSATKKATLASLLGNLTLAAQSTGFTIAGGTTSKTLTLDTDITASTLATKTYADGVGTTVTGNLTTLINGKVGLSGDETVNGIKTFGSFPVTPSSAPTTDYQVCNKKYVDDTAFSGVNNASLTAKGIVELATQAQTNAGTATGETGAALVVTPDVLVASTRYANAVQNSGDETVNGIKTFGSIPELPASNPTTANQATRKAYVDALRNFATGSILVKSNDTESNSSSESYTKVREIQVGHRPGILKVHFEIKNASGDSQSYGRIYKNGVAYGTERNNNTTDYVAYDEDLAFVAGDLIQLYVKATGTARNVSYKNFRLYAACPEVLTVNL